MPRRGSLGRGTVYKRGKWWHVFYSINGRKYRESAETTSRAEAIAYLDRKMGRLADGSPPTPDKVKIKDLLELVLDRYEIESKASLYVERCRVKNLLPVLGNIKACNFTSKLITEFIKNRLKTVAPATVNRDLSLIRRGYTLGQTTDPVLVTRVPHFPHLKEDNVRSGFLKTEDYSKLLSVLPDHLKLFFVFGFHLGMRAGELLQIKWNQVDFEAGIVRLQKRQTKGRVARSAPIYGDMAAYLERQSRETEYLFSYQNKPIKSYRTAWRSACIAAGVPRLLFHDLRRTAVRNMRRAGIDEGMAMSISGHKTRSIFQRYNIVDEQDLRDAGAKIEEFLNKDKNNGSK